MGTVKNLLPCGAEVRHRDRNAHHRCEVRDSGPCRIRAEWTGTLGGRCGVLICSAHISVLGVAVRDVKPIPA